MEKPKFDVIFLPEAKHFLDQLSEKERNKIIYIISKSRFINDNELFKKLNENIWEFRILFNKSHFRIFAFWDKSNKNTSLVIATHGLIKKSDKTPKSDLEKAESLRTSYFNNKKH